MGHEDGDDVAGVGHERIQKQTHDDGPGDVIRDRLEHPLGGLGVSPTAPTSVLSIDKVILVAPPR